MKYQIEGTVYYQRPADEGDGWLIRAEGKHAAQLLVENDHGELVESDLAKMTFQDLQVFWCGTDRPPQSGDLIRVTVEWPTNG